MVFGTRMERKLVSILIADAIGSTSLGDRLDPEGLRVCSTLISRLWLVLSGRGAERRTSSSATPSAEPPSSLAPNRRRCLSCARREVPACQLDHIVVTAAKTQRRSNKD